MPAILSLEDADGIRCVDIIQRADGIMTFKEFRRDPEDAGRWSLVADYSNLTCENKEDALRMAAKTIAWFEWPRSAAA